MTRCRDNNTPYTSNTARYLPEENYELNIWFVFNSHITEKQCSSHVIYST